MSVQSSSSVASPCVGVCSLDPETDLCLGCWRTQSEVAAWVRADARRKREIIARARQRREQADNE